ncbi:MAG: beta-lactamase family protein [Planctomycetia bacterium]|nr:beta-lactamase family protein [Planctomycetia bacterium]
MRTLGAVVLLLLTSVLARAQALLPEARPAEVGLSAAHLKQGVARFEKALADDDLRGAVLLVARDGKIVLHEALGWRDLDQKLPMQKDTLFHVASNTKPVVAAGVLLLVEEGKLGFDDEVRKHLPAFDNEKSKTVTIRQLLNHTSGFRIPGIFPKPLLKKSAEYPHAPSLRAEVDRIGGIGPAEKPGQSYSYNNAGYNTLGALIEVASKQPLEVFLTERFYRPLGMKDAYHLDSKEMVQRRAVITSKKDGSWKATYSPGDAPAVPFVRGSGGLITTGADYARFLQLFLNGGVWNGRRLLKEETVRQAVAAQTKAIYPAEEQEQRTAYYGFGWQVSTATGIYGHGGSDGTYAWVDPKRRIVGLIFTQSPGGNIPREDFLKLLRAAVEP